MNRKEILTIALKILSVYLLLTFTLPGLLSALSTLPMYSEMKDITQPQILTSVVGGILTYLLIAFINFGLIKWAEPIANRIAGKDSDVKLSTAIKVDQVLTVAFVIIGIYLIINALPGLISQITFYQISKGNGLRESLDAKFWPETLKLSLSIIGGLILIFDAKSLTKLVKLIKIDSNPEK